MPSVRNVPEECVDDISITTIGKNRKTTPAISMV